MLNIGGGISGAGMVSVGGQGVRVQALLDNSRVKTPSILVGATITMATITTGATIYYTTDGSTPDATDTEYTTAITLPAETTTYKAIAIKATMDNSRVRTVAYTVSTGLDYDGAWGDDYEAVWGDTYEEDWA